MARIEVTLGVDLGGTTTSIGFVDRRGRVMAETTLPTSPHQPAAKFFERLYIAAAALLKSTPGIELIGIGIGAPNANYFRGTIEAPPNLSWDHVDVIQEVGRFTEVPVSVTNDANAAALGEMLFGAAQGMRDFIVITLGTGLGSGIVVNGSLVYGAEGFAGELGHTIVEPDGRECGCGRRGCLETYASANGIRRTVHQLICDTLLPSELRRLPYESLTSRIIYEAASRGDRIALRAFEDVGRILGIKLADAVAHTQPEAIILFGGLAAAGDLILIPTRRSMEEHLLGVFRNKVKLLPSGLPDGNTAVLGAAALIWNDIERRNSEGVQVHASAGGRR